MLDGALPKIAVAFLPNIGVAVFFTGLALLDIAIRRKIIGELEELIESGDKFFDAKPHKLPRRKTWRWLVLSRKYASWTAIKHDSKGPNWTRGSVDMAMRIIEVFNAYSLIRGWFHVRRLVKQHRTEFAETGRERPGPLPPDRYQRGKSK